MGFKFLGEMLERNRNIIWFIYPYNKEFRDDLIVFSDETRESFLWQKNIYDLSQWQQPDIENLIRDTFRESNIFFSDDLTGTDFKQAIDFTIRK